MVRSLLKTRQQNSKKFPKTGPALPAEWVRNISRSISNLIVGPSVSCAAIDKKLGGDKYDRAEQEVFSIADTSKMNGV